MSDTIIQEFVIRVIDLVCNAESDTVLQSSNDQISQQQSPVDRVTSDGTFATCKPEVESQANPRASLTISSTEVRLVDADLATPEPTIPPTTDVSNAVLTTPEVTIPPLTTKVSSAHLATPVPLQADKKTSERQKLLKRRVFTIADYFAPLAKKTEQKSDGDKQRKASECIATDTNVALNDIKLMDNKPEKSPELPEKKTNDSLPPQNCNFLKIARRKVRSIFKKDRQQVPSCAYLDGYKQIAEDELKRPVINNKDTAPCCLGFGSFGVVDLMILTQAGKETLVAVKSFPYEDSFARKKKKRINKTIAKELKAMDRLKDIPEFPGVIGICKNKCGYHIVMEFIGDEKRKRSKSLNTAFYQQYNDGHPCRVRKKRDIVWLRVLLDIAKAINQMHGRGVLHCDIAARNVLVYLNEQKKLAGKLIDLGLACTEENPRWLSLGKFRTKTATQRLLAKHDWCAPEFGNGTWLRRGGYYSTASDVWAFGQMMMDISKLMTTSTADDLKGLIDSCTTVDPKERASAKYIQTELEAIILRIQLNYFGYRESKLI